MDHSVHSDQNNMIDENDVYESFMEDHMIATNRYKCVISGCENILTAPEFHAADGICRSHRGANKVNVMGFAPSPQRKGDFPLRTDGGAGKTIASG